MCYSLAQLILDSDVCNININIVPFKWTTEKEGRGIIATKQQKLLLYMAVANIYVLLVGTIHLYYYTSRTSVIPRTFKGF